MTSAQGGRRSPGRYTNVQLKAQITPAGPPASRTHSGGGRPTSRAGWQGQIPPRPELDDPVTWACAGSPSPRGVLAQWQSCGLLIIRSTHSNSLLRHRRCRSVFLINSPCSRESCGPSSAGNRARGASGRILYRGEAGIGATAEQHPNPPAGSRLPASLLVTRTWGTPTAPAAATAAVTRPGDSRQRHQQGTARQDLCRSSAHLLMISHASPRSPSAQGPDLRDSRSAHRTPQSLADSRDRAAPGPIR